MLSLKKISTYKPCELPTKNILPILLIPVTVFILYILEIIPTFYYKTGMYILIILYSATITFKYIDPYISKVEGKIINIFYAALIILIFSGIFSSLGFIVIGTEDPQQLDKLTNTLFSFLHKDIVNFIFVGIVEELICFYILFIFLALIKNKYRVIMSIIITSFIFGMLHAINWPIISTIPIFLGHIPYIYSYIKLKSLLPAMVAHSFTDTLAALALIPNFAYPSTIIIMIIAFILILFKYKKFEKILYS